MAYRDYGDEYVFRGFPFTGEKGEIRSNILGLRVAGGGDDPEAVYDALLYALDNTELGGWRNGVKKVIIVIGDAPPHTKRHTLDEVVKRAEEVDPAHVFSIAVAGSSAVAEAAFSELAARTGGLVLRTSEASELPERMVEMVALSAEFADRRLVVGNVVSLVGSYAEVQLLSGSAREGQEVLFLDPETRLMVVGRGYVTSAQGEMLTVEVQAVMGSEVLSERSSIAFPEP